MGHSATAQASHTTWVVGAAVVLACVLRIPGLLTDLWLDEIWSIHDALSVTSWTDVFLRLRLDNNHHLNTLYLVFVGEASTSLPYRLPALVSGVGTVIVASRLAARESSLSVAVVSVAFASSYLLAFYSSEARGYAPVVFFALLGWYFLSRHIGTGGRGVLVGFWACSLLGITAHPTFTLFLGGAFVWCDVRSRRTQGSVRGGTAVLLRAFTVPAVLVAAFFGVSLRDMIVGGGPPYSLVSVVSQTLSLLVGGPMYGMFAWMTAVTVVVVFVASLVHSYKQADDRWVLYLTTCVVLPGLLLVAQQPRVLFPRYFIVPAAFVLLSAADYTSSLLRSTKFRRVVGSVLVIGHLMAGTVHIERAWALGRGQFRRITETMLMHSPNRLITVGSAGDGSTDFRNRMLVEYFAWNLGAQTRIRYVTRPEYPPGGPDWLIRESLAASQGEGAWTDPSGSRYLLHYDYSSSDLSGERGHLYRRARPSSEE